MTFNVLSHVEFHFKWDFYSLITLEVFGTQYSKGHYQQRQIDRTLVRSTFYPDAKIKIIILQ